MADPSAPLDYQHVFAQHPMVETERLVLREIQTSDQDAIFEYASDPETTYFMFFAPHASVAESVSFIESCQKEFRDKVRIEFAIELKKSKKMIGACGLHHFSNNHHSVQIGYILHRAYWGHGYMTEAVRRLIKFAFQEMQMHRIEATCDDDNYRSVRVMERCGMMHEATFRDYEIRHGEFVSVKLCGKLATDQ